MKLTIVIPAYNEEKAIGEIIERSLRARGYIILHSPVEQVEIIVVSDGSTDRTAEIAAKYEEIRLIVFAQNRGYGAAIKRGFLEGAGELVGFLDADGTCDPLFFTDLAIALIDQNASVALGTRMGPNSKMPLIRRLGNRVFAFILSVLSNKVVSDTASGMRIIRRDVLPYLYPLPDGLHFTPAMSARVLMDRRLSLVERAMPYEERIGESKLNVVGDGIRFLRTIFEMTIMWQPAKLFLWAAVLCLGCMTALAMHPVELWFRTGRLQEDMIYRLLFCSTLGAVSTALLSAALISHHVHRLIEEGDHADSYIWSLFTRWHSRAGIAVTMMLACPMLAWLVGEGVWTWVNWQFVEIHWSRVVLAGLIVFGLVQIVITGLIVNILDFHVRRSSSRLLASGRVVRTAISPCSESVLYNQPTVVSELEHPAPV